MAVSSLLAEDKPEGQREDGHHQQIEETEVGIDLIEHSDGHLRGEVALGLAYAHALVEVIGDFVAHVGGCHNQVGLHQVLIEQDEDGGQQQDGAEWIGVVTTLAVEVIGGQITWAVEQVDERSGQIGLQANHLRHETAEGSPHGDALHRSPLTATRAIDSLKLSSTVQAQLSPCTTLLLLRNESLTYHSFYLHHSLYLAF